MKDETIYYYCDGIFKHNKKTNKVYFNNTEIFQFKNTNDINDEITFIDWVHFNFED